VTPTDLTQAETEVLIAVGADQREYLIGHDWEVAKLRRDGLLTGGRNVQLTRDGREILDQVLTGRRT
jgi:hypothetical protein